jgi:hypothetical protein
LYPLCCGATSGLGKAFGRVSKRPTIIIGSAPVARRDFRRNLNAGQRAKEASKTTNIQ